VIEQKKSFLLRVVDKASNSRSPGGAKEIRRFGAPKSSPETPVENRVVEGNEV